MGPENGRANADLGELLLAEPYRFEFFQAVRLLERLYPELKPVGRYAAPAEEVVRFRAQASLDFPPSEVHALKPARGGAPPEMIVAMMGLTGPSGVLPHAYTEQVMDCVRQWRVDRTERERQGVDCEHPLVDFLDIFNHRLISLFYRAWEKYHFPLGYERGGEDAFTKCLFALIGLGTQGLRGRFSFPDDSLLVYGGLLAQRPRSASALGAIAGDYFNVPARVEQFVPRQLKLDDSCITRLGAANNRLGVDSVAGRLVWDCQSKFRLVFGPLGYEQFAAFLPIGTAYRPAIELTQVAAGREFEFDIQPVLKADEVPCTMAATGEGRQSRLGWNTWLTWRNFEITEQSLQKLREAGLPEATVAELQCLKGRVIKGERQLFGLLRALLGAGQAEQGQSLIMEHSEVLPLPRDADQVVLAGELPASDGRKPQPSPTETAPGAADR